MLKIAVCDDDLENREEIKKIIGNILFDIVEIKIDSYSDGIEIIEKINKNCFESDLIILDINMKKIDGLKTAEFIRNKGINTDIIFLTKMKEHILDGYKYSAFDFLLKPVSIKKIEETLIRYLKNKVFSEHESLNINIRGKNRRIRLKRVKYFESRGRKIAAILENEEIEFYLKMDDLFNKIKSKNFIRCHQSYIINLEYIDIFSSNEIVLYDSKKIPVSRKYLSNVKVN